MAYIKTNWEDYPSTDTAIDATKLNNIENGIEALDTAFSGLLNFFYPVGTIYETTSTDLNTTTKMGNHFGGTWEEYGAGRVLVAKSADTEFDTIGETGGAKTHTLSVAQMPAHNHTYDVAYPFVAGGASWMMPYCDTTIPYAGGTVSTVGSGEAHNNLQPYIVVYRYRRTA